MKRKIAFNLSVIVILLLFSMTFFSCHGKQEDSRPSPAESEKVSKESPGMTDTAEKIPASPSKENSEKGDGKMLLTSTAFKEGEFIPKKYTGEGSDVSPQLSWENSPEGTKSFAIIVDDPDAPVGNWVHWVIFNISPDVKSLPENLPKEKTLSSGVMQGLNDFRKIGYNGPMPPRGKAHRYFFKLYALDTRLKLQPVIKKADLVKAMTGHILAEAHLMGKYKR